MKLRKKQSKFAKKVGLLILFAYDQGFELTFGDAWSRSGYKLYDKNKYPYRPHKRGSFHYKRLAIDLNLFKDGKYLRSTEDHRPLGEFWESIGGTWGGRFKNKDGNHYSWEET